MRRKTTINSDRIVEFVDLEEDPIAIYPDQITASRMNFIPKQSISQAIKLGIKAKGHYWMKLYDYDRLREANEAAREEYKNGQKS